tara:strand:+ start:509 stop:646 length:138 start_codon:yes stop_codon:yes gene_type:complete
LKTEFYLKKNLNLGKKGTLFFSKKEVLSEKDTGILTRDYDKQEVI